MSRYARRKDANHATIRRTFEQLGCGVLDVAGLGDLGCDLVAWKGTTVRLIEIKDAAKAPSARKLTDSEATMMLKHPRVWRMVSTEAEAVAVVQEMMA